MRFLGPFKLLVGIAIAFVFSLITGATLNAYAIEVLMYAGINITLAVSLNLVTGITGQFSMGHAGFMAVGGYVSAFISTEFFQAHLVSPDLALFCSLLLGGVCSAGIGYFVGLPSLRLRGDYLAIVTLGFGEIIRVLILNVDAIGGARGLPGIPKWSSLFWVYAVAMVCITVISNLIQSPQGRGLLAIREDEIAAEAMGVPTTKYKVGAFVLGAFFAGIAGGLYAHHLTYLNPATFDFNRSFEIIIMIVLGGLGSISGATLAALALTIVRELLRKLQEITLIDFRMIIYASLLIGVMLLRPKGLLGRKELSDYRFMRWLKWKPTVS